MVRKNKRYTATKVIVKQTHSRLQSIALTIPGLVEHHHAILAFFGGVENMKTNERNPPGGGAGGEHEYRGVYIIVGTSRADMERVYQ